MSFCSKVSTWQGTATLVYEQVKVTDHPSDINKYVLSTSYVPVTVPLNFVKEITSFGELAFCPGKILIGVREG